MERLTTKIVRTRLSKISPNIKILGAYKNCAASLKCKCLICRHIWAPTWESLSQGHGCPACNKRKAGDTTRFSVDQIKRKLHKISPNIEITGKYTNSNAPIACQCKVCRHHWSPTWRDLSQGHGCPTCGKKRVDASCRFTHAQIVAKLRRINPYIEILNTYKNSSSKLLCKCTKCERRWVTSWMSLGHSKGCCMGCVVARMKLSTRTIKTKLRKINPQILIIGPYTNAQSALKVKCLRCDHTWNSSWGILRIGHGCPQCSSGKAEENVRSILCELTGFAWPKTKPSEIVWLHGLTLDGYCRELHSQKFPNGCAFEHQGPQHYEPNHYWNNAARFNKQRNNDNKKKIQCWRHGVCLIRIPHFLKKDLRAYLCKRLSVHFNFCIMGTN